MGSLLANPRSGAGEATRPEGLFIDDFDGCVVGCVFGQIDEIVLFHVSRTGMRTDMEDGSPRMGVCSISVVAGFPTGSWW